MKIISDIRLFRSERLNDRGGFDTSSFGEKPQNAMIHRVVMKLREAGFSMGEFDHLYLNFTTCDIPGGVMLSGEADRYHPWFRWCSVRVGEELYRALGTPEAYPELLRLIGEVLAACFATEAFGEERILDCIRQAAEQGEQMRTVFKTKATAKRKATVYLRYLDSCRYRPLLQVTDPEDRLLLERDLPEAVTLDYLGQIQLSAKKVTIKPRKNAFTERWKPIVFEY